MFNVIANKGMPASWNVLDITSLYKKGDKSQSNSYRGLSAMHVFSKLYATCVNAKLTRFSEEQSLRSEVQAGFRANHRVDDNCVILKTLVQRAKDHKEELWACFIDLQKAYDSIQRDKLWAVLLNELKIDPDLVCCLKSLYVDL